ncbi:hypothetical protein [Streptomyces sp. NPDC052701]|uniref:hypothetical protein n=1 Tax=Streptomyces sp. NPDC052701 TaxID=3155533 RepID=UPI00343281FD
MEQRIGSSSQPLEGDPLTPLTGAGFDPAFVPGITPPASGTAEEAEETTDAGKSSGAGETSGAGDEDPAGTDGAPEEDSAGTEEAPEGPVFEAADRRARIVADRRGVRLALDDQECEFRWDEIAAVETETARFGKRFTVTVHTPDRRWYPIEIEAPARSRFAEWDAQLDAVLDAYFEDGA